MRTITTGTVPQGYTNKRGKLSELGERETWGPHTPAYLFGYPSRSTAASRRRDLGRCPATTARAMDTEPPGSPLSSCLVLDLARPYRSCIDPTETVRCTHVRSKHRDRNLIRRGRRVRPC